MKRIVESISFTERGVNKNLVMISCGESLNPISVHALSEDFSRISLLDGRTDLTDTPKWGKLNDWDIFRWDNPELPVVELHGEIRDRVLSTVRKSGSRFKKRQIPRYKTQSVIAIDVAQG